VRARSGDVSGAVVSRGFQLDERKNSGHAI